MVLWEIRPKRKVHTLKGKWTLLDHKSDIYTTKFTDKRLQKVGHRLQSLLIYYERLQKSDIDYNIY